MPKFQVISNLLGNAVKYSPDGGEVLITTSHGDGEVRISVKDHGVGIAPEDLPRLFQRYERINSKSGHKISGTGLGLVIARQIVDAWWPDLGRPQRGRRLGVRLHHPAGVAHGSEPGRKAPQSPELPDPLRPAHTPDRRPGRGGDDQRCF